MTPRELFEAIGLVDDALVLEADAPAAAHRSPVAAVLRRWAPLAACLCVFVGAVLVWRSDFGRMGSNAGAATGAAMDATADAGAAPEAAMAESQEAACGGDAAENRAVAAEDGTDDSAYVGAADAEDAKGIAADSYYCLLAPSLDPTLTGALTAGDGGGSYSLMAYAPDELYFADPIGDDVPETLPVYRSVMADHTVHEGDMRAALGQVLAGLAVDDALTDEAALVSGTPKAEEWQQMADQAAGQGQTALNGETEYWGGAATLTLTGEPALTAAGVERITVYNDLQVSVFFAEDENAVLDPVTDLRDAKQQAAAVQKGQARLLQYLGVNTAALEGGDRNIYGEQRGLFSAFYAAGQDGHAYPAATESLLNYSYRRVLVSVNTDGSPSVLHWNAAGPGTLLGEYPILGKDEALDLLRAGQCYGSYDGRVDCRQAADAVLNVRLVYTSAGAAYHVPVWEFMAEAGAAQSDDAAALGLKDYVFYYVPAVDIATLTELIEENG